jgi:hypothetical protein
VKDASKVRTLSTDARALGNLRCILRIRRASNKLSAIARLEVKPIGSAVDEAAPQKRSDPLRVLLGQVAGALTRKLASLQIAQLDSWTSK